MVIKGDKMKEHGRANEQEENNNNNIAQREEINVLLHVWLLTGISILHTYTGYSVYDCCCRRRRCCC
jgi:hypothetical protein